MRQRGGGVDEGAAGLAAHLPHPTRPEAALEREGRTAWVAGTPPPSAG